MIEQPHPAGVRLLPWKRAPLVVDLVLVAVTSIAVLGDRRGAGELDGRYEIVAGVITVALILVRRRYPVPALAGAVVAMAVLLATTSEPSVVMLAVLVTMYNVASSSPWRVALIVGATVAVLFVLATVLSLEDENLVRELISSVAWPALATAVGMTVAASRTNMADAQERAARAEATRELEAQRRASEERLRIARDVHDVVGHHLAVIAVQGGVAEHLLRSDTEAAAEALAVVRQSAATATEELGDLLSVLRADPEAQGDGRFAGDAGAAGAAGTDGGSVVVGAGAAAPVRPAPDLAAIEELVESFTKSGLVIEHERSGTARPLSRSAEVAAYRVVQEALTNAHKHGTGKVRLVQRFTEAGLEIVASNPPLEPDTAAAASASGVEVAAGASRAAGYGLVGMRERLASVGGALTVDDGPSRFEIRATIPTQQDP